MPRLMLSDDLIEAGEDFLLQEAIYNKRNLLLARFTEGIWIFDFIYKKFNVSSIK